MAKPTAKTMEPDLPSLADDAAVQTARERLGRISGDLADTRRKLADVQTIPEASRERHQERVRAIMGGAEFNGAGTPNAEHLPRLRDRLRALVDADRLARAGVAEAEAAATRRILEELRPFRTQQMARLAAALAELGTVAEEVTRFGDAMTAAGLGWPGYLPTVAVGWMRGGDPDSRLNVLIDEIARDYPEAEPDRPLLDAELVRRERVAAGPDGVRGLGKGGPRIGRIGIPKGVRKLLGYSVGDG